MLKNETTSRGFYTSFYFDRSCKWSDSVARNGGWYFDCDHRIGCSLVDYLRPWRPSVGYRKVWQSESRASRNRGTDHAARLIRFYPRRGGGRFTWHGPASWFSGYFLALSCLYLFRWGDGFSSNCCAIPGQMMFLVRNILWSTAFREPMFTMVAG